MAETTPSPLLDRQFLQETFSNNIPVNPTSIPNIPFTVPSTPNPSFDPITLPKVNGEPTPSALSAIENSVLSVNTPGALKGGSIPRSLNESLSDRYNTVVPGDYNNEDAYAQGEGWPSRMVNGVGKGLLLTGTTLLQTTVGTLNGLARMTEDGRAASFYDNDFNKWLDEVNKSAENVLPNYYTDIEKNANWYSPSKLFTANFLWDGIVKNLGFAAGAAISGGLYASALKALPLTARLFSVGKGAEALAATEEALLSANKVANSYGKVRGLSDQFLAGYKLMNPAGRALVAGLATTGEAGFEAFHNLNAFREDKIEEYKRTHGGLDPKGADLDAINSEADGVGNSSFLLNTALLSATNYIQFPKILGSSYNVEKGLINSLRNDISEVVTDASGNIIKKEAKTKAGKLLSSINKVRPYTFSTSEGFEEGAQYAISVGTKDYYNKKYDGQVASFLESMTQGISKTLTTNEGMENILIGGLAGAIMMGRGRFLESAQKSKNTADAIQKFNKWKLSDFTRDTVDSVNRGVVLQEEREKALRQGDILTSKDKEADYIINYLTPRIKYGRFDLVQQDISEYKQVASTPEGFAQLQSEGKALQTDTSEAYISRLTNLESTAANINSLYQSLNLRYGNLVLPDKTPLYSQEIMDQMIYAATKVADYDQRIPELTLKLSVHGGIILPTFMLNVSEGGISEFNKSSAIIDKLDILSEQKETLKQDLTDLKEIVRRRRLFLEEYDEIKKNPIKFKNSYVKETETEKEQESLSILPEREYQTEEVDKAVVHKVSDEDWQVIAGNTVVGIFATKEEAESERDNFNIDSQSTKKIRVIQVNEDGSLKAEDSNGTIIQIPQDKVKDYELIETDVEIRNRKEREQLEQQESIKKELVASKDNGIETIITDTPYEPEAKKTNLGVVTSTKPATTSILPHHVRANTFGQNLDKFPNRDKIKGVLVTSKTESQILPGLTKFLKGDSNVDVDKIIVLVMVDENGIPIGIDGKTLVINRIPKVILTDGPVNLNSPIEVESGLLNYAVFQVMPDPKLEWSKEFGGNSMFRKETTPEQIEFYKKQYSDWVNETLERSRKGLINIEGVDFSASFGIPEYVTYLDEKGDTKRDYTAKVSVQDARLIQKSDLVEKPLIHIPTVDTTVEKGSTIFNTPLGRPFLNLSNGFVPLQNRKLTKKEASTIYEAIHQLSIDIFKNGNAKSENSRRLINWLKSIVYWGTPKNKIGHNSIFFDTIILPEGEEFSLILGGKNYPFIPISIEQNKAEITSVIEGLYNNINSGLTDKPDLWNEIYEEITNISPSGVIESKQWKNYQTYLLSQEGRKAEELPLSVQIKPISENETNRTGIYFTIKDTADRYAAPPAKQTVTPKLTTQATFVLDGKTLNTFISPAGKKINFFATSADTVKIAKGGDLDEVLKTLTAQIGKEKAKESITNGVKRAVTAQIQSEQSGILTIEDDENEEQTEGSKKLFGKFQVKIKQEPKEEKVNKIFSQKPPARVEISKEDEEMMTFQIDDLEDDFVLRAKLNESISNFEGENWSKTEQWLKDNFPNLPVYRVKNVIETVNGIQAWGMLKNGAIYVYENAEVGTVYHEVFEGVWKIFATPNEISSVSSEFKDRKGSFIDRPTGKTIKYSEATDQQLKEQLAEEFRDFVQFKKVPQKPDGKNLIVKLFNDIINFIKSFFTGNKSQSNTEKLFNKIGTGYYKEFTPTSQLSFAKKGIIDIEEAFGDSYSEFRVKNVPADVINDIMQQMTYITFTDLLKNNKSLFSLPKVNKKDLYIKLKADIQKTVLKSRKEAEELVKSGKRTTKQVQDKIDKSVTLWKTVTEEWESITDKHTEYLKVYSIEFDENDDVTLKDEDASKKGDYQDATKIDIFKKANSAIKLLLSTLPRVDSEGKLIYSSINGASLIPTSQVFMAVMNKVHSSRNIDEMIDRIKEMSEEDNNYKTLYNRLTKNTDDLSQISEVHDAQLLTAFWRTFKKQSPDVKNVYIFENGDVEVGDSNLASAARQISSEYSNAIIKTVKDKKNTYFTYSEKEKAYIGVPGAVKSIGLSNDTSRINFLKSLSIEFTEKELKKLSADKLEIFREATAGIRASIEKANKIVTVSRKVLDIKGRLMQLSLIRAAIDNPEFDSTFFNVKGERTQTFIGTNPMSDLYDYLSQISNKNELLGTPYEYLLTDNFSKNSVLINKMFNPETGNRIKGTEQLMKVGYADGTINTENGKKKQSAKLTYKERLIQELNLNLNGYYYNLVPGDASMEWMVYMGNPISSTSLLSGYSKVYEVFKGYFISELNLSREERTVVGGRNNKDLRFLQSILGAELQAKILKEKSSPEVVYTKYQSQIESKIKQFVVSEASSLKNILFNYGILKNDVEGITVENLSFAEGETITEEVLDRNLTMLSANFAINNIELHKVFYSDPYQYSDELKRVKNASSPRQALISNSPNFNASLNKLWNTDYNTEDIGYTDMTKDYFKTVTLADIVSTSDLKDYENFEETDGGGIISMKAYRWFRIKAGEWTDNEERQYNYDIAFEKKQKGIELFAKEVELLEKGNPTVKSAYTPLKPIVFGNKANTPYNNIILDKFALYPLSYRIAYEINPTSNAVKHYNKLQREGIDYSIFASGRKVGSEGNNSLYNSDGSFNELPYNKIVPVPHSIISIQSEVPSKDEPLVTRGSQITKLATLDFMEAGVPIDFGMGGSKKGSFKERFEIWNNLSEKEKIEQSILYKEIKNNQFLLEELIDQGYKNLLERMGIEEIDGDFIITDINKVGDTLKSEILKREVNDNILDAFEGFKNGDTVLEATPAYQQIRNILYSIADKDVISPKISGGQKVQIPSTLLESVRAKEEKGAFISDNLQFYEDKDGKRVAEIMIGRWFDTKLSDKELLKYLNNTQEGQKILSGIGYRIPTQKQNSIDSFVIKQFLPQEFGDSVIIPSALVKKVGSDFDIDKLFIYFKNVFKDKKGNIKLIQYKGSEKSTKDFYTKVYEDTIAKDISKITRFEDFRIKMNDVFQTIENMDKITLEGIEFLLGKDDFEFYNNHIDLLQDISEQAYEAEMKPSEYIQQQMERLEESKGKLEAKLYDEESKKDYINRMYKKALENAYIESLQNLVSHPLNFENLIKPNSADQLKSLAKEVTKALGTGEFDYKSAGNMLDRGFMSRLRHSFVSGKYAIGIAAVNQTNHSLNQRQPIYIDPKRWDLLDVEDKYWLSSGTLNAEDVTLKFKDFNKIEINDQIVPTLSMIKNSDGDNISDIIGQFIDGYVDISKGPWIMELGAAPNVASVWLFLIKVGVPINDVAYFMNQPIIKDYLLQIESAGYSWLFIQDFVEDILQNDKYATQLNVRQTVKEIPGNLKSTVGKKTLSPKERAEQQFILMEFLKYAKMANQMFLVTQGSNFDTATFNDPYLVFKKSEQLKKAQNTIISSVNDLIKNSFIGKLSNTIYNIRDAFSTVLISDRSNVRDVVEDVLRPYVDMSDRDFVKLAQKTVNDLFDWAVQNDRNLNTQIQKILLSDENTAKQVSDFVVSIRKNDKHPLYNNQIVKLITPHFSSIEGGVNNLKIKNKDNKVYDQNQMIYAFAELKNYLKGQNSPLYGAIVRLSVLQSGLSNSPISFTSLLPYEDFKEIYNKTLSILETLPNLQDFNTLNVTQRNNWNNDDLVPVRKAKKSRGGEGKYNTNFKFYGNKRVQRAIDKNEIPQLLKINTKSREAENDVMVYTWQVAFGDKAKKMREKGDYSYIKKGLFKKIYQGDEPFTQSYTIKDKNTGENIVITDIIYKPINAWGDSHSTDGMYFGANEFYTTGRPSVIENGFMKVQELSDETLVTYFTNPEAPIKETKGSDEIPNCL